ncbi:hypothetical protein D5b_00221 [Faustovirus]|nr:hypothetical protein D5b_00221 [Faustovirus]AMN84693.1 hypothetical protein D6_00290 [Faustovirus]
MLATLYYKSVPNNIIVRANNTLYNDINDEEIQEYIRVFKEAVDYLLVKFTNPCINPENVK